MSRWGCLDLCISGLRAGFWLRCCFERVYRASLSVRKLEKQRRVGSCVGTFFVHSLILSHLTRPAFIAGVTNPIFENSRQWDLFLNIGTGSVTVSKDIHTTYPAITTIGLAGPLITRTGTLKAESSIGSEDDIARMAKEGSKGDLSKDNNADKLFIDDVSFTSFGFFVLSERPLKQIRAAIEDHFGESLVRMRFTEYVTRFVRLASRYEEEITGTTAFGFPSLHFSETPGRPPKLGSGIAFSDDTTCLKELAANSHRIEAWRKTNSYKYLVAVRPKLILSICPAFFIFLLSWCRIMQNIKPTIQSKVLTYSINYSGFVTPKTCWTQKR